MRRNIGLFSNSLTADQRLDQMLSLASGLVETPLTGVNPLAALNLYNDFVANMSFLSQDNQNTHAQFIQAVETDMELRMGMQRCISQLNIASNEPTKNAILVIYWQVFFTFMRNQSLLSNHIRTINAERMRGEYGSANPSPSPH